LFSLSAGGEKFRTPNNCYLYNSGRASGRLAFIVNRLSALRFDLFLFGFISSLFKKLREKPRRLTTYASGKFSAILKIV
jgi:hypothetical protein